MEGPKLIKMSTNVPNVVRRVNLAGMPVSNCCLLMLTMVDCCWLKTTCWFRFLDSLTTLHDVRLERRHSELRVLSEPPNGAPLQNAALLHDE